MIYIIMFITSSDLKFQQCKINRLFDVLANNTYNNLIVRLFTCT